MKTIDEIINAYQGGMLNGKFNRVSEQERFEEVVAAYGYGLYNSSALLSTTLYETLFTNKYISLNTRKSLPDDFIACLDNVEEQLFNLDQTLDNKLNNERKGKNVTFKNLVNELCEIHSVLTEEEACKAKGFYDEYRIPVAHGLDKRLYRTVKNVEPDLTFDFVGRKQLYKEISEMCILELYEVVSSGKLLNK